MSKRRWGILIGVLAVAAVAAVAIAIALSGAGVPAAAPTPTPTPTPAQTIAEPSPTPTPTVAQPPVAVNCETTSTVEFQAMMADNGWVSWETQNQQIGAKPFERFPDGPPQGAIVCRWGESADVATDNVIDLAWTPLTTDAASAAQQMLVTEGYEQIDDAAGLYFALPAEGGVSDSEGYAATYLFTDDDVRWARTKAEVAFVKAPDEAG